MRCRSCLQDSHHIRTIYDQGQMLDMCHRPECGDLSGADAGIPDVYLARSGQKFENLCDDMGRPIAIQSKRHKKEVMDKLGVSEVGDRVNGAPYGSKSWIEGTREYSRKSFEKDRPMIQKVYKQYLDNVRRKRA